MQILMERTKRTENPQKNAFFRAFSVIPIAIGTECSV